jgi:hypothetical protein
MFEDFRKQIIDDSFKDEHSKKGITGNLASSETRYFLGLRPFQRFIIAFLLLVMTIALGVLFLLVTARIVPPV